MALENMPYLAGDGEATEDPTLLEHAKRLAQKLLVPHRITGALLHKYIRKAMQTRAWPNLSREARLLLTLAARRLKQVKSPTLKQVLANIILEIEQHTTRGQAIIYGLLLLTRQATHHPTAGLRGLLRKALYLGITYLNNPPNLRILG